jgi:hypothetical protein
MSIKINGHDVEPGCYCEGHRGQYGPDHVFDLAVSFGFPVKSLHDDMNLLRAVAERLDEVGDRDKAADLWQYRQDLMDDIETWMNDNTVRGVWGWDDGEFFLEYADNPDANELWVCETCYFAYHGTNEDGLDGTGVVPLSLVDQEHWDIWDGVDVERRFGDTGETEFSRNACEGCTEWRAGKRYRLTMTPNQAAQESYLTEMSHGYIECALWSSTYEDEHGETWHLDEFDVDDIGGLSTLAMQKDCEAFMKDEWALLCDIDPGQAGHDFWLTRNHHGAGFWDRGHDEWLGKHLTDAAHAYGSADLIRGDDGVIEYHA